MSTRSLITIAFIVAVGFLAAFILIIRKKNRFRSLVISMLALYALLYFVNFLPLYDYGGLIFVFAGPIVAGVRDILPVIAGLLLAFRLFSKHIFPGADANSLSDYSNPAVLKDAVCKIFDSENLLSVLRTSLPIGRDDEKFGFDYIPFMLSAIDERRKRAQRSARFFLVATTVSALIFSAVVMYFGYILVNEASAGTAKTLADIKASTESTAEAIHSIIPSYYNNPEFQKNVSPSLDKLAQLPPGDKNLQTKDKIVAAINETKRTADFLALNSALTRAGSEISKEGEQERTYSAIVADAINGMSAFIGSQNVAIPELNSRIQELKLLVPKAEETLSKPENRIPEIIKRLALGLVISTFFLALLRYMGTLYRTRYQQVLAAENDDFMVRRFYVAFKSSEANDDQRKAVLSAFMAAPSLSIGKEIKDSGDGTKEQYEVLKDLLGALSKKL